MWAPNLHWVPTRTKYSVVVSASWRVPYCAEHVGGGKEITVSTPSADCPVVNGLGGTEESATVESIERPSTWPEVKNAEYKYVPECVTAMPPVQPDVVK